MTFALAPLERRWRGLAPGLALRVAGLSLIPRAHMPEAAARGDKLGRLAAYAALALPAAFARPRGWPRALAAVAGFSAAIEFVQPLANRTWRTGPWRTGPRRSLVSRRTSWARTAPAAALRRLR